MPSTTVESFLFALIWSKNGSDPPGKAGALGASNFDDGLLSRSSGGGGISGGGGGARFVGGGGAEVGNFGGPDAGGLGGPEEGGFGASVGGGGASGTGGVGAEGTGGGADGIGGAEEAGGPLCAALGREEGAEGAEPPALSTTCESFLLALISLKNGRPPGGGSGAAGAPESLGASGALGAIVGGGGAEGTGGGAEGTGGAAVGGGAEGTGGGPLFRAASSTELTELTEASLRWPFFDGLGGALGT